MRAHPILAGAVAASLIAASALAQAPTPKPPQPPDVLPPAAKNNLGDRGKPPTTKLVGPRLQEHVTPNGLKVVVAENHALPLVTIELAFRNGSMTEPKQFNGLSHLYEHMFFKGNAVIPDQLAYMRRVNELGMRFNGTTSTERVNYFFTTTKDHLDDAMVFMRDAILTLRFDEKELEAERVVVTGEMDRAEANPYFLFNRAVEEKVWYRHPTRKNPLGSRDTVLKATPAMMKTIQKRYYLPNNGLLVVTGDVKAKDIFQQADTLYAEWKKSTDPFRRYPLVTHPPLRKSEVVVMEKPVNAFTGTIVWHGPSVQDSELWATYAADVLGTAVGQPSSRFQRALVDSGACLGASLGWLTQRNVGPLRLSFQAAPNQVDACVKAVFDEVEALAEPGYLTEDDLQDAAYLLKVDKVHEREKPSSFAHIISFWWASASLDYYRSYVEETAKVTPADITKFATTYMKGKPFVLGALRSEEVAKTATAEHLAELAGIGGKR